MIRCARCGKPVTKRSVTAALTAVIAGQTVKATAVFGPTCARKLGLKTRTTRRYAVAVPRVLPEPVEVLDGQPPLFGDDEGNDDGRT